MNATDATAAIAGTLISLLLFAALYIWVALALSAVFRKSGVESWKAWVPVLNTIVLLELAGLSPWLVVLAFVPFVNIAFLVVFAIALYRVNLAFGYGAGMTVVGLLLFPVWASIVGWGSARWVGRETDASSRAGAGVRRSPSEAAELPAIPPFPATSWSDETRASGAPAPAAAFAPPAYAPPMPPSPASFPSRTSGSEAPAPVAHGFVPPVPPPPAAPAADRSGDVLAPGSGPAADASPGGWTPPAAPGRPVAAAAVEGGAHRTDGEDADPWQGFALDGADLSGEITGAFPGAPGPISAVPAAGPVGSVPPADAAAAAPRRASAETYTAPAGATSEEIMRPPVSRVPAGGEPGDDRVPWAPARSPMSEADAFPEASGPVSAIVGAPDAGSPRSARSSVSAFHAKPEIPDEPDGLDETIIARRKRTDWTLVPPTGDPVSLSAEVVILGRRPARDPDFPGAQLVSIQDGTVSKTHARLQLRGDRWYVTDLDSTNGVLFATVMGTEVEAPPGEEVEAGDRFLLGDAEVRLKRSDG
ncbi:DUF5684 domain-containing protein [Microbacterium sp. E-13]|uniref:DUF5684 domain-containing protein n=1 Tax=Microbacterium sp. E-13 TaxID=3404048 RepID=UPI003CE7862D